MEMEAKAFYQKEWLKSKKVKDLDERRDEGMRSMTRHLLKLEP